MRTLLMGLRAFDAFMLFLMGVLEDLCGGALAVRYGPAVAGESIRRARSAQLMWLVGILFPTRWIAYSVFAEMAEGKCRVAVLAGVVTELILFYCIPYGRAALVLDLVLTVIAGIVCPGRAHDTFLRAALCCPMSGYSLPPRVGLAWFSLIMISGTASPYLAPLMLSWDKIVPEGFWLADSETAVAVRLDEERVFEPLWALEVVTTSESEGDVLLEEYSLEYGPLGYYVALFSQIYWWGLRALQDGLA